MTPTLDLDGLRLSRGAHDPGDEMCVMEAVAYVAGEPWSDEPECASRVIGAFLRTWNDGMDDDDRQILVPLIPRLVGTAASEDVERARSFLALDWLVRTATPAWLRLAGMTEHADMLAALPELTSAERADAAVPVIRAAGNAVAVSAAVEASDAAAVAVGRAAWDATWAAARAVAVAETPRDATWAAARAAAQNVAAMTALRPTVTELQQSALALVDRMIQLTEVPA